MPGDDAWNPVQFTRLRVTLDGGPQPWSVPVDYYRLLRAGVYRLLGTVAPDLAEFLHTGGFSAEFPAVDWRGPRDVPPAAPDAGAAGGTAERFKLFCFSSLIGKGALRGNRLFFDRPVAWFFATPLGFLAEAMLAALRQAHVMQLGRARLNVADLRLLDEPASAPSLTGLLLSPLVISATLPAGAPAEGPSDTIDPAAAGAEPSVSIEASRSNVTDNEDVPHPRPGRQRYYLTREDGIVVTEARLRSNLLAKHRALYGTEPAEDAEFRFLWAVASEFWPTPDRPTRLIRLSGTGEPPVRVRGNLGTVTLAGSPDLLQLSLHAGLGQHNASGLGFVLPAAEASLLPVA